MENDMPKFLVHARVFAKMKGYTAWPAIIDGIHLSQTGKFKYDVFFYGTNQVGTCREEELKSYIENRTILGRPKHYKGFNQAVKQMDQELGLVHTSDFGGTTAPSQSQNEDVHLLVVKKRERGRPRSRTRSPSSSVSSSRSETNIRTRSLSRSVSPSISKLSIKTRSRSVSVCKSEPAIRTRSRSPSISRLDATIKRERGRPRSKSRKRSMSLSTSRSEPATIKRGRGRPRSLSHAVTDVSEDVTSYNPNQTKSRSQSQVSTSQVSRKLSVSHRGGSSDTYAKPNRKAVQCIINPDIDSYSERKEALEFLKNEAALNNAIFGIQGNLSFITKADLKAASVHIDEFFILDLNPLVLKKHPEAVDTLEKLQSYSANFASWNMSLREKKAFQHDVKIINEKAKLIYNRIKGVFQNPDGKDFSKVFEEELNKFNNATKGFPMETVWKMTRDPTLV